MKKFITRGQLFDIELKATLSFSGYFDKLNSTDPDELPHAGSALSASEHRTLEHHIININIIVLILFETKQCLCLFLKLERGKDHESIQSSTTPDSGYKWESNKLTIRHHRREPRGQPFPSR